MTVQSVRDLVVWRKSMDLFVLVHRLTRKFPRDERIELTGQLRRASESVGANIAEGTGRTHLGDYPRHLSIARGSVREVESHLEAAYRLRYVSEDELRQAIGRADEVSRMLLVLMRRLGAREK